MIVKILVHKPSSTEPPDALTPLLADDIRSQTPYLSEQEQPSQTNVQLILPGFESLL